MCDRLPRLLFKVTSTVYSLHVPSPHQCIRFTFFLYRKWKVLSSSIEGQLSFGRKIEGERERERKGTNNEIMKNKRNEEKGLKPNRIGKIKRVASEEVKKRIGRVSYHRRRSSRQQKSSNFRVIVHSIRIDPSRKLCGTRESDTSRVAHFFRYISLTLCPPPSSSSFQLCLYVCV